MRIAGWERKMMGTSVVLLILFGLHLKPGSAE